MTEIRQVKATCVQVCGTLAALDSAWVTLPWLEYLGSDDGCGQVVGSASFRQIAGARTAVNSSKLRQVEESPGINTLAGRLLRVLEEDTEGVVEIEGRKWSVFWHGRVIGRAPTPARDGEGNGWDVIEFTAMGIAGMLTQLPIRRGWALSGSSDATVVDPGTCLLFNADGSGFRSTATHLVNGQAVYVHDVNDIAAGYRWTARQILELVLAGAGQPEDFNGAITGWPWYLNDPDGCLAYYPETIDLHGRTLFDALTLLAGERRGMTWRAVVLPGADFVTIQVRSASPVAITVGAFTLPASSETIALDYTDDAFVEPPRFAFDYSNMADEIVVLCGHSWIGLTIEYGVDLSDGWSPSSQDDWAVRPELSYVADVYRRFVINADYNGKNSEADNGLADQRLYAFDAAYGQGGYVGDTTFTDAAQRVLPARALVAERTLPCGVGFTTYRLGARQEPVIVLKVEDVAGSESEEEPTFSYIDATGALGWGVMIETDPPAVRIEDGSLGLDINGFIYGAPDSGNRMLVTLGLRELLPMTVSWVRPRAQWPCSVPRVKTVPVPTLERWMVLEGTVMGVNEDGTLKKTTEDVVVRDDLPSAQGILALLRAWFAVPDGSVTIVDQGRIDRRAATRPGVLVTTVTTGSGTETINWIITRRAYRQVIRKGLPQFDTVLTIQRVLLPIEAVL